MDRINIPVISPFAEVSWADQKAYTYIEDIDVLGINGNMSYVGQRQIADFAPGYEADNIASEGFGFCSGLVILDRDTGSYTVSHLEPRADAWLDHMRTGSVEPIKWDTSRDVVLVYGSLSSSQYQLERLMTEEFWGPASLRVIKAETGDTHWGMALSRPLGELALVRKKPEQTVLRYKLFDV